jgi:hypothetical protein
MHRSGTSALAGALAAGGVHFGADLLPAADENPNGFWEHREVVQIHDSLLEALGSSWDDIRPLPPAWWEEPGIANFQERLTEIMNRDFGRAPIWGLKDPRICRLLPLWKQILNQLGVQAVFVIPFRHPVEVARSLQRRDGFTAAKSGFLWLDHNLCAEAWSRGQSRVFVNFDSLTRAPGATVQRILTTAGSSDNALKDSLGQVEAAVVSELRHQTVDNQDWELAFGEKGPLLAKCHHALTICGDRYEESAQATFDALQIQKDEIIARWDEIATSHIADLQRRISKLENTIDRVRATPRRRLIALLRRLGLPLSHMNRA